MNKNKYLYFFISFFLILSILFLFLQFNYFSGIMGLILLLISFVFIKTNVRFFVFIFIVSFCSIFTNALIIYNMSIDNIDIFKDKNILLGTWKYNELNGKYVFNSDYSYIQYISSYTKDNYCIGKYDYSYGGVDDNGNIIKFDDTYYYYTLNLHTDYCVLNMDKDTTIDNSSFVFLVNKNDSNSLLFMDTDKDIAFSITKSND